MSRMTAAERDDRFQAMIAAAAAAGDADQRLAMLLADPATDAVHQTGVAAALGEVPDGPAGRAALRDALAAATAADATAGRGAKHWYTDLRCACLTALARREGAAASDILAAAAGSPNPYVRCYAITALAAVGDDRAWELVMTRLVAGLRRRVSPRGVAWHQASCAIEYLARHAPRGSDRAIRLITVLRSRWHHLADPELINRWWPAIGPGREPASGIDLSEHRPRAWWERW